MSNIAARPVVVPRKRVRIAQVEIDTQQHIRHFNQQLRDHWNTHTAETPLLLSEPMRDPKGRMVCRPLEDENRKTLTAIAGDQCPPKHRPYTLQDFALAEFRKARDRRRVKTIATSE